MPVKQREVVIVHGGDGYLSNSGPDEDVFHEHGTVHEPGEQQRGDGERLDQARCETRV